MNTSKGVRPYIRHPDRALFAMNKLFHRLRQPGAFYRRGVNILEEDWDNLIILDACRLDYFRERIEHTDIDGVTESQYSRGSMSEEFVRGNFRSVTRHDLVYVSSNWFFSGLKDELESELHAFYPVDHDAPGLPISRPETTTRDASETNAAHPQKRLIVHYMQPHWPYFGPSAERLQQESGVVRTIELNELSVSEVRALYRENVDIALEQVEELLDELVGKTVITADHGELLGERQLPFFARGFGHPRGVYVPELLRVPWHVIETGERKTIVENAPVENRSTLDQDNVEQNLRDLGYVV